MIKYPYFASKYLIIQMYKYIYIIPGMSQLRLMSLCNIFLQVPPFIFLG